MVGSALRIVWPSGTIPKAPEFIPAKLVQSDVGPDKERGQLISVSHDTGSNGAVDELKEQQAASAVVCKLLDLGHAVLGHAELGQRFWDMRN